MNLQEDAGVFNPDVDGIDFYESLEGMLLKIDNPVAVSATDRFGQTWIVADDGDNVTSGARFGGLNERGGVTINADSDGFGDLNPELIEVNYDFTITPSSPDLEVGDDLGDITGVLSYSFGNFEVLPTEVVVIEEESDLEAEVTTVVGSDTELSVASYNVLNLTSNFDSGDNDDEDEAQMALLAEQIVNNLGSPDIIGLQEIQDNSGVNFNQFDGVTDADQTLQTLVDAIVTAGGPTYSFVSAEVDMEGENGGVPGGNIRNAFLYNADRVTASEFQTLETDELAAFGVTNTEAFNDAQSRDPLLGVFEFNGEEITIINNHFESRSGSEPIFGGPQPFDQAGEEAREQQALALNQVVDSILASEPGANVVVLGDFNTFEFTDELTEDLLGVGSERVLTNLLSNDFGADDLYTFIFEGNSQVLDHIFVTDALLAGAEIDITHVNTDFGVSASDHEPVVASFVLDSGLDGIVEVGSNAGDDITGTGDNDQLSGQGRSDVINGEGGDDIIDGGRGGDVANGGMGDDLILGGSLNDQLFGDEGNDTILGEGGLDTIVGGADNDMLSGGRNADMFVFDGEFGLDMVTDYNGRRDAIVFENVDASDVDVMMSGDDVIVTVTGGSTFGVVTLTDARAFDETDLVFI